MKKRIVIVGNGGHSHVIMDLLEWLAGDGKGFEIAGFTDPDTRKWGTQSGGYPVLGGDDVLPTLLGQGVDFACLGIGSVSADGNKLRKELFESIRKCGFFRPNLLHPRAIVALSHECSGNGLTVMAGAIINPEVRLGGDNIIVNTGAIIEHHCVLESHVHISPGARLAGGVTVREGAYVGLGASVIQDITIGAWATVGAGAVVIRDVPEGATVVGVPAYPIKYPLHQHGE